MTDHDARELAAELIGQMDERSALWRRYKRLFAPVAVADQGIEVGGKYGGNLSDLTPANSAGSDAGGPGPQQIINIGTGGDYSASPHLTAICLAWTRPRIGSPGVIDWVGSLEPYAELSWTTGRGQARAIVDIPAGGTMFTVGGADGLEIKVGVEGTTTTPIDIQALVNVTAGGLARPAQRTTVHILPGAAGTRVLIPAFARAARVEMNTPVDLPLITLDMFAEPVAGARVLSSFVDESGVTPIPVGAASAAILGGSGAANQVNVVWELWL